MSYDIKFKQRAVEYQKEGHTYKETCKVFKISETTLTRWINKEKEGKLGEVKIKFRNPKKINPEKLIKYIQENPEKIWDYFGRGAFRGCMNILEMQGRFRMLELELLK